MSPQDSEVGCPPVRYAIVFTVLAVYLLLAAWLTGGIGWVLLWPAAAFSHLAAAYAGGGPAFLGKRPDGRLAWWAWLLAGPVLVLLWGIWRVQRFLSGEPACHEVHPGLWLGRRPVRGEIPNGVALVVDLTAEFPGRCPPAACAYLALPTLDGTATDTPAFEAALAEVLACPGPVYVHCAMGHGRSATLAAAVLLRRGVAKDVREAEEILRRVRPGVRLKEDQRALLRRITGPGS